MSRASHDPIPEISPQTLATRLNAGEVLLVDVREPGEYAAEHIAGALLLPLSGFEPALFPALSGRLVVLHCAIGKRSQAAARMLRGAGHKAVAHMTGGLKAWKAAGLETELPLDEPENGMPCQSAPAPGEVLAQDYLAPRGLDGASLAKALAVDGAVVQGLLAGTHAMDSELSLRLARLFSTEPDFWMQLQLAHDLQRTRARLEARIAREIAPRAA